LLTFSHDTEAVQIHESLTKKNSVILKSDARFILKTYIYMVQSWHMASNGT